MKAIQVTFDEELLHRLDRHPMVREQGRSAVLREAAAAYLARKDAEEITERYREGYLDASPDDELQGWAGEGVWPADESGRRQPPQPRRRGLFARPQNPEQVERNDGARYDPQESAKGRVELQSQPQAEVEHDDRHQEQSERGQRP